MLQSTSKTSFLAYQKMISEHLLKMLIGCRSAEPVLILQGSTDALQLLRFRQQKSNYSMIGKGEKLYQLELRDYISDNPQLIFF